LPDPVIDPGDGGDYAPELDPADFVATVDNPWLPLVPGSRWVYEENGDAGVERIEVVVLDETRDIGGITATVVRDTVTLDGVFVEDTLDWFAQDRDGNVWYLGEDVDNFDDEGNLVDHDGSFEAGVDGAHPGIAMLADPQPGDAYRQEFYEGEAEDNGAVLSVDEQAEVPAGHYENVLLTRDTITIEPDVLEYKLYAPGVGPVLVFGVSGGGGREELIEFTTVNDDIARAAATTPLGESYL
jgi:hypothetical protein